MRGKLNSTFCTRLHHGVNKPFACPNFLFVLVLDRPASLAQRVDTFVLFDRPWFWFLAEDPGYFCLNPFEFLSISEVKIFAFNEKNGVGNCCHYLVNGNN